MARFGSEAAAALIFLIGYILIFIWMTWAYANKIYKWRSRYTMLYFHVLIRIASQVCGVIFGILAFENTDAFLAYLILGAEGYFTLVLCAFRFLISWHQHNLPNHESWLEPRQKDISTAARWKQALIFLLLGPFVIFLYWRIPMVVFHCVLILANTLIVTGGSYLAGAKYEDYNSKEFKDRMRIVKATRTTGQSIFLTCNFLLLFCILYTIRNEKRAGKKKVHPTLIILTITWIPLIIRGVFGVLQAAVWSFSYYNPGNYEATGFSARFIALEYMLGVVTEWVACVLLNATYLTSRRDPSKGKLVDNETSERSDEK